MLPPARRPARLTAVALLGVACAREAPPCSPAEAASGPYPYAASSSPGPSAATTDRAAPPPRDERGLWQRYEGAPALSVQRGKAVYYGDSLAGNHTANGEVYDPTVFTAAHRKLPFNSVVRVIRLDTGRRTYVRVTDRGPFGNADRIIDLARVAAQRLDMIRAGVVDVRLEIVQFGPR